jgi:5-methylthioribose kinase
VQDDWRADRSRIYRERQSLLDAARFFPRGAVPEVLWSDEARYLFAMSAAEPDARNWKTELLGGRIDPAVAAGAGTLLGLWIRSSWGSAEFQQRYGDQAAFDQLRIDPYYRTIARRHPEVAGEVEELIHDSAGRRVALVHGDWSPKNFLLTSQGLMVIDFEVVHFGDPTFDAAFCINHFLLKCFRRPGQAPEFLNLARVFFTWTLGLLPPAALVFFEPATCRHLACLLLARMDGKSPAEYLTEEPLRRAVRETALLLIRERPQALERCYQVVEERAARL